MKRNDALKIINLILVILFLNQVLTALFHGSLPGESYDMIHGGGGILFAVAAIVHLILNWNWVKASYFRKKIKN